MTSVEPDGTKPKHRKRNAPGKQHALGRYNTGATRTMWRDANIFNEVAIPAATFGFRRKTALGLNAKFVDIDDLVDCAKMYALVALDICGVD